MLRLRLASLLIAATSWACSGEILTDNHAGSASGVGGGAGEGGGGSGGTGGAGAGGVPGDGLSGHYMQQMIGDCINAEEWLSFDPPTGFTHTLVDRNFCSTHSVEASPGQQAQQGDVLEITWKDGMGSHLRHFTFALVDPLPPSFAPFPVDGYQPGTRALNDMGYARTADPLVWHREDLTSDTDAMGTYDRTIAVDVAFDAPLGSPSSPTACSMKLTISIEVAWAGSPETGQDTLSLPCTIAPDPDQPWMRVTADGFENPNDGKWWDYLTMLGIPGKYSNIAESLLYDSFYPMFFYAPGDEAHLFHDRWQTWYVEYLNPPPDQVN